MYWHGCNPPPVPPWERGEFGNRSRLVEDVMDLTLVILAAGLGTRYGGLKQLEPVGPGGAPIMDYSIYDARRAGFAKVVFIIRPEMEAEFRASIGRQYEQQIPVAYALQRAEAVPDGLAPPPGRTKPWGTGHAVLSAELDVSGPLAVVNADDFYGVSAFRALSEFLGRPAVADVPEFAMVGYALRDTLSATGRVSRAICRCNADGWLQEIVETTGIERHGGDGRCSDGRDVARIIAGDTLVSMNAWGFTPVVFDLLRAGFGRFLMDAGMSDSAEFHLPAAVRNMIEERAARVRVLPGGEHWCGVTHREDKSRVVETIARLIAEGEYPQELWD